MLGAIIGDIVGSRFEWRNNKSKDFTLFTDECAFTDDTVMTLAVASALSEWRRQGGSLAKITINKMRQFGRLYPYASYGTSFSQWLIASKPAPYNSYGNGAAMRISPVADVGLTMAEVKKLSYQVTAITHNHPEGIKGAEATATAIFLAKSGKKKEEIKDYISAKYYPFTKSIDEIRPIYLYSQTCQDTVPQALLAFLESESFEDAIRNAVSLGGDSDTLAAICGSVAAPYYGIPRKLKEKALTYLDEKLNSVINDFYHVFQIEE